MKNPIKLLLIVLFLFSCQNDSQLNTEYNELQQIKKRQSSKVQELKNLKNKFKTQIRATKTEIKDIIGDKRTSYNEITNKLVIDNKLKLIQRRLAYANELDKLENQTLQALQITEFTIEDIKDKIALGQVLGKEELNQILKDIDKIKNTSLPKTNDLALNIKNSELQSFEDIWNNIILKDDDNYGLSNKKNKTTNSENKGENKITVDKSKYNFGTIEEGKIITAKFKIFNRGITELVLNDVKTDCDCAVPIWDKKPINVGSSTTLEVKFNSKDKKGTQNKKITLKTNFGAYKLELVGEVKPLKKQSKSIVHSKVSSPKKRKSNDYNGVKLTEYKSPASFNINAYNFNNTYYDNNSGLEWLVVNLPKSSWYESKTIMQRVNSKLNTNWRIPSLNELYSIAKTNNTHNVGLKNELKNRGLISGIYWTNNTCEIRDGVQRCKVEYTNQGSNSNVAYALSFSGGASGTYRKSSKQKVILVKNRKTASDNSSNNNSANSSSHVIDLSNQSSKIYYPYGKGYGRLQIFLYNGNIGDLEIWIDNEYLGKLTQFFPNKKAPDCNQKQGTLIKNLKVGNYKIKAKFTNGTSTTINAEIKENTCHQFPFS